MAYQPVPVTQLSGSSNLTHLAQVYYKRKGLDRLLTKFVFRESAVADILDRNNGKTAQFFRYTVMASSTSPKSPEGSVGTSLGIGSRTVSVTLSQYTNFITVSDFAKETAIDDLVQSSAELLGEMAGLSVDIIVRTVIDAEATNTNQALLGTYLAAADFRNSRALLQGVNVQPLESSGHFNAYAHPYVTFDLVNDPTVNSIADTYKYTSPDKTGLVSMADRDVVGVIGSCRVKESTNVYKIAGSPNKWRVYVFGRNAYGVVDLAGRGPANVYDPKKQKFNIYVEQGQRGPWDPEGVLGGFVSYNFKFGTLVLDGAGTMGGTYRFKTIDAPSSIVS